MQPGADAVAGTDLRCVPRRSSRPSLCVTLYPRARTLSGLTACEPAGDAASVSRPRFDPPPAGPMQPDRRTRRGAVPARGRGRAAAATPAGRPGRRAGGGPVAASGPARRPAGRQVADEFQAVSARSGTTAAAACVGVNAAVVGDQVGDGHVGLVADAADDRDRRFENRLGDDLLVERPKVFETAAAAADDDGVDGQLPLSRKRLRRWIAAAISAAAPSP